MNMFVVSSLDGSIEMAQYEDVTTKHEPETKANQQHNMTRTNKHARTHAHTQDIEKFK